MKKEQTHGWTEEERRNAVLLQRDKEERIQLTHLKAAESRGREEGIESVARRF